MAPPQPFSGWLPAGCRLASHSRGDAAAAPVSRPPRSDRPRRRFCPPRRARRAWRRCRSQCRVGWVL